MKFHILHSVLAKRLCVRLTMKLHTDCIVKYRNVWQTGVITCFLITDNWNVKVQSWFGTDLSVYLKNKDQLDATYYFIVLLIGSTCFGHYFAHHQEPTTIMLIITLVVWFCKDGRGSVNVKLWFLVVYVRCEVLYRLVAADVFLLISYNQATKNLPPHIHH